MGLIAGIVTSITTCSLCVPCSDAGHVLPHRADIIIFFRIIVEAVVMERIGLVSGTLLNMEAVIFDVGLHAGFVHETVVFFRAVSGVCDRR